MVYFDQILHTYFLIFILKLFIHMYSNGGDALPSIIMAGRGILVKMLIALNGMLYSLYMYFDQIFLAYP